VHGNGCSNEAWMCFAYGMLHGERMIAVACLFHQAAVKSMKQNLQCMTYPDPHLTPTPARIVALL